MKKESLVRLVFAVAGFYDGLLGLTFLIAGPAIFTRFAVTPPNHWGYVQFPALLLIVFALMFFQVALAPSRHRNLMPYGVGLKLSYSAVTLFHWFGAGIPGLWKPFAIVDLVFVVLFAWAFHVTRVPASPGTE